MLASEVLLDRFAVGLQVGTLFNVNVAEAMAIAAKQKEEVVDAGIDAVRPAGYAEAGDCFGCRQHDVLCLSQPTVYAHSCNPQQ